MIATLADVGRRFAFDHQGVNVMNSSLWWRGVLVAVLVIGVTAAIGIGSYNAGVAQGIAESGRALAAIVSLSGAIDVPSPVISVVMP